MKALHSHSADQQILTDKAIRDYLAAHKSVVGRLICGTFEIRGLDQAEKLSTMLASNYPAPERVSTGIWELMCNAIEHGNLEIDFNNKSKLIQSGHYTEEISRRLAMPNFSKRVVLVEFKRTKTGIRLRVTDEGPGFDYKKFLSSHLSVETPNGRGILIATKFSFDKVIYRGRGNVVDAITNV